MERKEFIKNLGLGLIGTSLFATSCKKDEENTNNASTNTCSITGSDDLGPFFVAGTANIVNLNTQKLPGTLMKMKGKVYSGEGSATPIEGAKIEIWHADDNGAYHPEGSGDVSKYPASKVTLRGFVLTEKDGSFAFQSIRPGLYGDRARHIHYKITANNHSILVTQSYFTGDARIAQDSLAKNAGDCRIVTYTNHTDGSVSGEMNFNLKKL